MKKLILIILIAICSQVYGQKTVINEILRADTIFYIDGSVKDPLNYWPLNLLDTMEQRWILDCARQSSSPYSIVVTKMFDDRQAKLQTVIHGKLLSDCIEAKRTTYLMKFATGQAYLKPLTIEDLIRLYDEYARECYADSTSMGTLWGYDESDKRVPIKYWQHKDPDLEGFIEFLKKH